MSENKQMEVVETTEVVEVTEKVGILTKAKEGFKKHKKAIIVGGLALGAAAIGLVKLLKNSGDDVDCDFCEDGDYIDVEAEEVDDDETIE